MDDLNLSFTQQMQIIMKDVLSSKTIEDEDQNSEKSQVETEDDHEVSNTHSDETEDEGLVGDMDQVHSEADQVSELMNRVVKAVNVARQDNFPYLQHPGKIIYLKKRGEEETKGDDDDDVGDRHVALTDESLRVPQHLPLLASMVTDHCDHKYRLAVRSLHSHDSRESRGFKRVKEVLNSPRIQ